MERLYSFEESVADSRCLLGGNSLIPHRRIGDLNALPGPVVEFSMSKRMSSENIDQFVCVNVENLFETIRSRIGSLSSIRG